MHGADAPSGLLIDAIDYARWLRGHQIAAHQRYMAVAQWAVRDAGSEQRLEPSAGLRGGAFNRS